MCAFIVLGLVFSIPSQEIGFGKCLRNDLFCIEWDVKQNSINQSLHSIRCGLFSMLCIRGTAAGEVSWTSTTLLCRQHSDLPVPSGC